jgi:hypothetical protein
MEEPFPRFTNAKALCQTLYKFGIIAFQGMRNGHRPIHGNCHYYSVNFPREFVLSGLLGYDASFNGGSAAVISNFDVARAPNFRSKGFRPKLQLRQENFLISWGMRMMAACTRVGDES